MAGHWLWGDGSFKWTMIATGIATAASLTAVFIDSSGELSLGTVGNVALAVPLVTAIVVYEATSSTDRRSEPCCKGIRFAPTAGPTRDLSGGTLGIAGLF